jgi:hypothetical protein
MFTLKMVDNSDASKSILIPFDQKWEAALQDNQIRVVFRKRGPKAFKPNTIFVYVGAPTSRLIGCFKVKSFDFLPISVLVGRYQQVFQAFLPGGDVAELADVIADQFLGALAKKSFFLTVNEGAGLLTLNTLTGGSHTQTGPGVIP